MSISLYRPTRLSEIMNRLFDESFVGPRWVDAYAAFPVDVYTTEDEFVITAATPGLRPEDLNVEIQDGTVTISGEMKGEEVSDKANWLVQENRYGKFSRSITLPTELDGAKAEAIVKNGMLTLRIPKAEAAKPKTIKIQAK